MTDTKQRGYVYLYDWTDTQRNIFEMFCSEGVELTHGESGFVSRIANNLKQVLTKC